MCEGMTGGTVHISAEEDARREYIVILEMAHILCISCRVNVLATIAIATS
jgi:hypothetical protein